MENWISQQLSGLLDFPVPDDLINYILSIDSENDFSDYMNTLLDFKDVQHKNFYVELCKKKFPNKGNSGLKQQKKKISKNKHQQDVVDDNKITTTKQHQDDQPHNSSEIEQKNTKKKTKFVNLYSQEGKNAQTVLLKGRHRCDCQASKHNLINNCLQCGRVVCKQEGSGPCLFCGNLVCTAEELKELNTKSKSSAKLMESLMDRRRPKGWEAAMSHRNRLLEYDRTSERRTRVTDDDSDYFNAGSVWLSSEERGALQSYQQSLHEKKHASRLSKKMTFDFAGRQIVEDNSIDHEVDQDKIRQITAGTTREATGIQHNFFTEDGGDRDVAPGINAPLLQFDPSVRGEGYSAAVRGGVADGVVGGPRVQDSELQEMSDTGRCLSMHQPWASLLVDGIKMHEGRTWYHSHRGRLWIASTAKPPDPEDVKTVENMYKVLYPDKEIKFPTFYPTGCLLGCVHVDDCLSQEEYQKLYPGGESDSPYVFICSNPTSLRLRFPVKGQHKIWTLDKAIHHAAVKCLLKMGKMEAEAAG